MKRSLQNHVRCSTLAIAAAMLSLSASAQITFYENNDFQGRTFSVSSDVGNFAGQGFNDRASSVVVLRERWEVCENTEFGGRCKVLRPGHYPSLAVMGLNDRVSSVRALAAGQRVEDERYAPTPPGQLSAWSAPVGGDVVATPYDARRRNNERLYQARVLSTRAVVAAPEQRCWVEPGQVSQERSRKSVPGGVVGALIGGILGHQIGGGTGRDIATAAGAVGGAVVGARVGRDRNDTSTPDVRRCENTPANAQNQAEYWDVTYTFRGKEHHMQMTTPPGATVSVNSQGEPRV
jgi:uncharacterized protein YcfJ